MTESTTHFGYERVRAVDKAGRVKEVFDSVADRYDLMNDLMSLGVHRLWKRFAASLCPARPGHRVLDLAAGTGDMTRLIAPRLGNTGSVMVVDINREMLQWARRRLLDAGLASEVAYVQANAESLPLPDNRFDCVCMAFGLRNVTDKLRALEEICRVLRPGGQLLVLEFSALSVPALAPLYDAYSFQVLPRLGRWVAGDAAAYQYLAESIRTHPDQPTLQAMMESAGLEKCTYQNLSAGIAAVHRGYKL